jgi:uncharacterized protein with NRDE domain
MCFVLVAFRVHPDYPLVVAANRDEYYGRRARSAHWWRDPVIFGGRDEVAGGTWFAVDRHGRFATVTNYRDPGYRQPHPQSRGELVTRFLSRRRDVTSFGDALAAEPGRYAPFNILFGGPDELGYYNNRDHRVTRLTPGIYGLGNALLDTPWPKLLDGKRLFGECLADGGPSAARLFEILGRRGVYADDLLPDTGLPVERERALSALFIEHGDYGTRCSTLLTVDRHGTVDFEEHNHAGSLQGERSPRTRFAAGRNSTPTDDRAAPGD